MARRMPRSGEERRTTVTEHIEVTGQQLHRAVLLERCRLAVGKRPVDLSFWISSMESGNRSTFPTWSPCVWEMATKAAIRTIVIGQADPRRDNIITPEAGTLRNHLSLHRNRCRTRMATPRLV